jgi:NADH dehydrogenase
MQSRPRTTAADEPHRIVIVGGGAGGLELATRLGDRLGKRGRAHITLIDKKRTHFWKPHLHEIAAGSMNLGMHELSYMAQGHWHGFTDRIGEMTGLDRIDRIVHLAPHLDESGETVTPSREIGYDTLVLAVGSRTNDFGTPGVAEYAIALESPADAEHFHRRLVNACIRAQVQSEDLRLHQLQVAIVGAGATGVELAAELKHTTRELLSYGMERLDPAQLGIHLIEAGPRILPALPQRISDGAQKELRALNVTVHTNARVSEVQKHCVQLADGRSIPAELVVWAAGVKAPEFPRGLDGLEVNRIQQLHVRPTLQTTLDDRVFAIGDCAACEWLGRGEGVTVPPRAQAAHQQAEHLADGLVKRLSGKSLKPWRYRDFGSLVSLGRHTTIGNLTGGPIGRGLWVDGYFAWLMYVSLYQMHQRALHGLPKVALDTVARMLSRGIRPRVKLH